MTCLLRQHVHRADMLTQQTLKQCVFRSSLHPLKNVFTID